MENVNNEGTLNLTMQLSELVAPMQGAGSMLKTLADKLSTTLNTAATTVSASVEAPESATVGGEAQSKLSAGASSLFEGLFASFNEQFSGIFTKLFGGGEDGEGLFGTLGALFGSEKDEDGKTGDGSVEGTDKIKKANGEVVEDQKNQDNERVKSDAKAWGAIVGNALAGSKKLRKIKKAAAIGSVIIDTAKGIAKTFAEHGFPGGIPYAIALAAKGAAEIKTIKGQAHDGINNIPSTGTYLLERGERVVDSRLNTDLSGFLKNQNGAVSTINSVSNNNAPSSVTNAPVINMRFGSGTDENTVSSNRGAMESMIREVFADYAMDAPFG